MAGLIADTPSQIGNTLYQPTASTSSPTGYVDSQGTPVTLAGYAYNPNAPQVDGGSMANLNASQVLGGYTPIPQPLGNNMATNPLSQYASQPTTGYTPASDITGMNPGSNSSGSFSQGSILPNVTTLTKSQTSAPSFYTDYLSDLSTKGRDAAQNSQYVGAQPLQEQAFSQVGQNVGNYQPTLQNAINLAGSVGQSNLAGAIGNLGEANIRRNLAPQATAGLVGSGQFGSSRGATALGDTIANAELGITAQQQAALQQDYQNRLASSQQLGNLASQTQALGLGDVNALSTLGGQQQTIKQNEQLFPMQQLTNQSALLRGFTIPTSTTQATTAPGQQGQFSNSPLQNTMSIATLLGALAQPGISGTSAGKNLLDIVSKGGSTLQKYLNAYNPTIASGVNTVTDPNSPYYTGLTGDDFTRPLPTVPGELDYLNDYSTKP
jgi:hypothetical protein